MDGYTSTMDRNPTGSLEQGAMLSARNPGDVLGRSGRSGGSLAVLLVVLVILGAWMVLTANDGDPSQSPSPSPSASVSI